MGRALLHRQGAFACPADLVCAGRAGGFGSVLLRYIADWLHAAMAATTATTMNILAEV